VIRLLPLAFAPILASAATTALFSPFPSDSAPLPVPDCAVQPTACREAALLNQLDGFSLRARAAVGFSGPIDLSTVAGGVFFAAADGSARIPLDQVIFDPRTNTLYGKPAHILDQGRRYVLIVTDAVTDSAGAPVAAATGFQACMRGSDPYCKALANAVAANAVAPHQPVSASLFTTMHGTTWLESARTIVANTSPGAALVQPQGSFAIANLSAFVLHEQTGANPTRFADIALPLDPTLLAGLDRVVVGTFQSPNFLQSDQTIPPGAAAAAQPPSNTVYFNALLPGTAKPANGYPVVIFGHGFGDSRWGGPTAVAPTLARYGFATVAINAVGHGFGPLGTVTFTDKSGKSVTLPSGGRSLDLNGDGVIEANEGCAIVTPLTVGLRDCFRQTVVDLMQLTHAIRAGLDLDGDGKADLDPVRIYYAGESLGGMYGTIFSAIEPSVRAAMLNVGGGSTVDIVQWSPAYRGYAIEALGLRQPPLLNHDRDFEEDSVLPGRPPHVTTVPGAIAIQNLFENLEWLSMSGDPLAFAPHLGEPVLFQFARADRTMPNPATSNLIQAAAGQPKVWEYRHDLARAKAPDLPLDPHPFLALFVSLSGGAIQFPGLDGISITLDAQQQMASFFAADGLANPNPNLLSTIFFGFPVFEVPTTLPTDFGYSDFNAHRRVPLLR
jgi:hypothetical protein